MVSDWAGCGLTFAGRDQRCYPLVRRIMTALQTASATACRCMPADARSYPHSRRLATHRVASDGIRHGVWGDRVLGWSRHMHTVGLETTAVVTAVCVVGGYSVVEARTSTMTESQLGEDPVPSRGRHSRRRSHQSLPIRGRLPLSGANGYCVSYTIYKQNTM